MRIIAVALVAAFSFPLISPLIAVAAEATLPACCRRTGNHRCAMRGMKGGAAASSDSRSGVTIAGLASKCPLYPVGVFAPAETQAASSAPRLPALPGPVLNAPEVIEQAEAHYRVSFSRAWQKRGPPSLLS